MISSQIRNTFLKYFEKNNHQIIHSSSLVPESDPTLMFANSGMVQFKNIFTGKEKKEYSRVVTAQKCVRAGGKHNDLDNVGYTARHHTFFEMLGNFSFGDYFKDIAIELAWNLITKEYGIDKNKLIVTVYDKDEEAYFLWKKIAGLSDDKIIKINTSDNFWSMGNTGPCGPCSEIFYDHGEEFFGGPPGSKNEDGDRFIEIWNLVFMQYEQLDNNNRIDLPKPSIDTGMGLERVTALLQNTNDNYNTDIFTPLINRSIELTNNEKSNYSASHKVIADHLRSSSFLISDGVLPSNEGRGYVLRRIMRRGMRHAHSLGNNEPVFHKIFPTLLNQMKNSYPELERAKDLIIKTMLNEETKFKQTIDNGLKILEEEIINTSNKIFDGEVAFKLYDTYGFPLDLTQDYLKNKSMSVDINAFNSRMLTQKQMARKKWKGTGDIVDNKIWYDVANQINPTEFIGYIHNKTKGAIEKIICKEENFNKLKKNDEAAIILNETTFYGESGGQVGDTGNLYNDTFDFLVTNTTKIFGNYIIHWGKVLSGECNIGDQVSTSIDAVKRDLIRNNHSSTHLLHASLKKVLGNHVMQKGSLVNDEKLRFDFSHNDSISSENIFKIEEIINDIIKKKYEVETEILDQQTAINSGATALFGEKYGDEVRVISISQNNDDIFSRELCGGTHVLNTGDIDKFKIINQSSIASGVRRIEAVTNVEVNNFNKVENMKKIENDKKINEEIISYSNLINKLNLNKKIILNKDVELNLRLKEIKKIYNDYKDNKEISKNNENILIEKIGRFNLVYLLANEYPIKAFKLFIDQQKIKFPVSGIFILVSKSVDKVSIIIGLTKDLTSILDAKYLVKIASSLVGGKGGGGRKDLAQAGGNSPQNTNMIYDKIKNEIIKLT